MANTAGEKELKTEWPIETGLIAETTKQEGRTSNLVAKGVNGVKSTVPQRYKAGL